MTSTGNTCAPGTMPSMSLCGIRNRRSPLKPTTSASSCAPFGSGTVHAAPTGSLSPTASMTRPATRVMRPETCIGSAIASSSLQSCSQACQRRVWKLACADSFMRRANPKVCRARRAALPARRQRRVDLVAGGFDAAAAAIEQRVVADLPAHFFEFVADAFAHQQGVVGIQEQQGGLLHHRQIAHGFAHHRNHALGLRRQRRMQHRARKVQRQIEYLLGDGLVGARHFGIECVGQARDARGFEHGLLQTRRAAFGQAGLIAFELACSWIALIWSIVGSFNAAHSASVIARVVAPKLFNSQGLQAASSSLLMKALALARACVMRMLRCTRA
jgi:hypothetical protein